MKIKLECESKIAYDSPDHINPYGTRICNSSNKRFNQKVYNLFRGIQPPLGVLDLGCSGGIFVRDCNNDGCLAIGLEGSDYSKKFNRSAWGIIKDSLFTCDISKDFSVCDRKNSKIVKFNLITAWEVLEHIKTSKLEILIKNIKKHLADGGIFIASISSCSEKPAGIELHQTQKSKKWWINLFLKHGMYEKKELYEYFNGQYINGGKKDTESNFHLIVGKDSKKINFPKLTIQQKILDKWVKSKPQEIIKYLVSA